jgi:hypothetical protein
MFKSILFLLICIQCTAVFSKDFAGLVFHCPTGQLMSLKEQLKTYASELSILDSAFTIEQTDRHLNLRLTHPSVYGTLYLRWDPQYNITEERISLPGKKTLVEVETVSKKEILLALMHEGRETVFKDAACDIEALKDHVQIRQMIVAWSEHLHWSFPDPSSATGDGGDKLRVAIQVRDAIRAKIESWLSERNRA